MQLVKKSETLPNFAGNHSEQAVRQGLATLYRAAAMHGWDDLVFTHISARVPGPGDHFLINEYGVAFGETTASNLVKVDAEGRIVDGSEVDVNPAGFIIHSAIHRHCPEAHYVMHLHSREGVAVAAQKDGFLPISQQALMVHDTIAYHDYGGIVDDEEEQRALLADAGDKKIVVLRNHGTLFLGASPMEVFLNAYFYQTACEIQLAASTREINPLPERILAKVVQQKENMRHANVSVASGAAKAWNLVVRRLLAQDATFLD